MIILNGNVMFSCGNADVSVPNAFTKRLPGFTSFVHGEKLVAGEMAHHLGPREPNSYQMTVGSEVLSERMVCAQRPPAGCSHSNISHACSPPLNGAHTACTLLGLVPFAPHRSPVCPRRGMCQASFLFIQCSLVPTAFHWDFFLLIHIIQVFSLSLFLVLETRAFLAPALGSPFLALYTVLLRSSRRSSWPWLLTRHRAPEHTSPSWLLLLILAFFPDIPESV